MTRLSCFLLSLFLFFSVANVFFANAATISLEGERRGSGTKGNGLARRAGIVDLMNRGDLDYYTNITLGGRSYRVLLDGGSADLWVAGEVPKSAATSHMVTIHYEDAYVLGEVKTANLQLPGVTIVNQSYVEQAVDASHPDGQGILGIGSSRLSSILSSLSSPSGNTVIDNLIEVEGTGSSFVTSLVKRPVDGSATISTQLTIGEVDSDHMDVQTAAQLPVSKNGWDLHWLVSIDDSGMIGPDNLVIRASKNTQLKVVFDSGYTMSQVPEAIAAAIYSRVPGAKLATTDASPSPVWTVPCDFELNVTFKFGGVAYLVHPLDTVMRDITGSADDQGSASCIGTFQPSNASNPYDILLGMTFLRNAYILMNLGNQPYVQLQSLTDPVQAHLDFVQQRLGGVDTTGSQQLLGDNSGLSDKSTPHSAVEKSGVFIIAGTVIGTLIVFGTLGVISIWCHKRRYHRLRAVNLENSLPSDSAQTSPASAKFKVFKSPLCGLSMHIPRPSGVEKTSPLNNIIPPGVKPGQGPESPKGRQPVYAQEDGPILIIGEKPLPISGSNEEEDVRSPPKCDTDSADLSLSPSEDRRRLTNSHVITMPPTPASLKTPARADTPDPYDLPPLPPPAILSDSHRVLGTSLPRPLPNPHMMPGNRPHSRVKISAFESFFGRSASRRSKRNPVSSINTSSKTLGQGNPGAESKKASRTFSLRRSRGRP